MMKLLLGELAIIIFMIVTNTGERHSPEFDIIILIAWIIYLVQFITIIRKNAMRYLQTPPDFEVIDFDKEDELGTKISKVYEDITYINLDRFYGKK